MLNDGAGPSTKRPKTLDGVDMRYVLAAYIVVLMRLMTGKVPPIKTTSPSNANEVLSSHRMTMFILNIIDLGEAGLEYLVYLLLFVIHVREKDDKKKQTRLRNVREFNHNRSVEFSEEDPYGCIESQFAANQSDDPVDIALTEDQVRTVNAIANTMRLLDLHSTSDAAAYMEEAAQVAELVVSADDLTNMRARIAATKVAPKPKAKAKAKAKAKDQETTETLPEGTVYLGDLFDGDLPQLPDDDADHDDDADADDGDDDNANAE